MRTLVINGCPVRTGATAAIAALAAACAQGQGQVETVCIDDYSIGYCKGCRNCHTTAKCGITDDFERLMDAFRAADRIILVAPSYWAELPGQLKVFIDRCTPYCDTHEPHATIGAGKKGYAVALRTGPNMPECERLLGSIEHFYGHMGIQKAGRAAFCSIEGKQDVLAREEEIRAALTKMLG